MNPQNIKTAIEGKVPSERLKIINGLLDETPEDANLLVARGKALGSMGRRGEAMSDYTLAAKLDPDGPATLLIEHSNSIMDFFNPDLLNP